MKNTFFALLLVLCFGKIANGQNLVMDPSFEQTVNGCAGVIIAAEGFSDLVHWDNISNSTPADTCTTPDLFSTCNTGMIGVFTGVPNNFMGNQCPKTGEKYAGIITYDFASSYREYLQGSLSTPLQAGQTYCVSFLVSLGDDVPYASNNIGVHFANTHQVWTPACGGPWSPPNLTPQLNYTCVMTGTEWVRLQWDYVATGGEQYIIIGNFFNNGATTTQTTGQVSPNPFAYYYVEDVSVSLGSCCYTEIIPPNQTECEIWENANSGSGSNILTSFCITDAPVDFSLLNPVDGITCNISSPSVTGTWSGQGITNATNGTFSPAAAGAGIHTITFTTSCGYVATAQVAVSPCNIQVCSESNGNLTASGGVAPYQWSYFQPGSTTPITNQAQCTSCGYSWVPFVNQCLNGGMPASSCTTNDTWISYATGTTVAAPPSYPIQITDAAGYTFTVNNASSITSCSSDPCATTTITINITPTHASCTNPTSGSALATPSGGTGAYTYSWNTFPVQTNQTATNLGIGTYTVTVTDANNCTATQSVTITQPSGFTVSVSGTNPTCNGGTGSATATVTGGTSPFSYVWSPSGGNGSVANNLAAGTYTVNVTDGAGCVSQGTVQITEPPALNLTMSTTNASCGNSDGTASVSVTGGTGSYTYNWSPSGGTGSTTTPVGIGTYTVTVTDAAGCTAQNNTQVTEASGMVLTMNSSPTQCTTNTGTASVLVSGGTGPYTYSWSPSGGSAATTTPVGQGTYTVMVIDASGCQAQNNVIVGVVNSPAISVINSQNVTCFGLSNGSAQVQATGGTTPYAFSWSPSGLTGATVNTLSPGTHTVTVTDHAGCTNQTQVVITEPTALAVSDTITNTTCGFDDGEISLTVSGGTGGYTYIWTPNVSTTNVASNLPFGNYGVIVRDAQGCSDTLSLTVIPGTFFIDAYPETSVIDLGGSISLNVYVDPTITVDTFFWTPTTGLSCTSCLNPVASPTETTNYIISVISDNGCIATDTVTIIVIQPCGDVFVPNVFSPNGDGLNDLECVMGDCVVGVDFTIYNRWGEVVFSSDDQNYCWDGTFRGKPVQTGVYVYKLTATLNTGEQVLRSGNINVTR